MLGYKLYKSSELQISPFSLTILPNKDRDYSILVSAQVEQKFLSAGLRIAYGFLFIRGLFGYNFWKYRECSTYAGSSKIEFWGVGGGV